MARTTTARPVLAYRVIVYVGGGRESTAGIFRSESAARREADRILAAEPFAAVDIAPVR